LCRTEGAALRPQRDHSTKMKAALALALLAAACDPRLYAKEKEPEKPPPADEPSPPLSPFSVLGSLGKSREPGPFEAPPRSNRYKEGQPHAAVVELHGSVVEL